MGKQTSVDKPLMFIDQPIEPNPELWMQQTYSSMYDQKTSHEEDITTNPSDSLESVQKKDEEPSKLNKVADEQEEKLFSDLSIEEKVLYCTSMSSYVPTIVCMIKTEQLSIVGVITKYEEGIVHIKPQKSRLITEVPLQEINSIRMVGF